MARRPITVRKPKIVRTTRTEQYLVNKKYLGDEPTFNGPLTKVDYIHALNWYGYMNTTDDAREYLNEYLKNQGRIEDAKKLKSIPDVWFPVVSAWTFRLVSKGFEPPSESVRYADEKLLQALSRLNVEVSETDDTPKVSVQDRMKEKFHDIMGEIEGLIDDHSEANDEFSLYHWLQENKIPPIYISRIIQKISPVLKELLDAYNTKDDQLKEGYKHLTKAQLKKLIVFFEGLRTDADLYANNSKKVRKPRKPRAISVEKKLKNFKFQKEDAQFKIASINPEKIIGSQELWLFNTRYKTITCLKAKDRGGLQVKGTSVVNYDEVASKTKGTGRRAEFYLSGVREGGKIVLRNLMEELKTDKPLATRTNENTILLRVVS